MHGLGPEMIKIQSGFVQVSAFVKGVRIRHLMALTGVVLTLLHARQISLISRAAPPLMAASIRVPVI